MCWVVILFPLLTLRDSCKMTALFVHYCTDLILCKNIFHVFPVKKGEITNEICHLTPLFSQTAMRLQIETFETELSGFSDVSPGKKLSYFSPQSLVCLLKRSQQCLKLSVVKCQRSHCEYFSSNATLNILFTVENKA